MAVGQSVKSKEDFCGKRYGECQMAHGLPVEDDGEVYVITHLHRRCAWAWYLADGNRQAVRLKHPGRRFKDNRRTSYHIG